MVHKPRMRVHLSGKTVSVEHLFPIQKVRIEGLGTITFSPPATNSSSSSQEAMGEELGVPNAHETPIPELIMPMGHPQGKQMTD